jgi:carbonic anhydrase
MFRSPRLRLSLLAICGLYFSVFAHAAPAAGQAAEPPEKPVQNQNLNGHPMDMNVPSGASDKCDPKFTYEEGPRGPSHWKGVCNAGHMQTPINITNPQMVPIPPLPPLQFSYQPADLDLVNDCNTYEIKLRFPDNQWLKVARKPYRLSEIEFHEPGENAVNGIRPPMSMLMVHLSPESTLLVIEVPIVVGKENPVLKTLLEHIPKGGKERVVRDVSNNAVNLLPADGGSYRSSGSSTTPPICDITKVDIERVAGGVKINAADLLPADHGFYRFPGSLTTPICNEGVQWYLMKHPIEMSQAQIDEYKKYYHNTARPLQPLNNRPLVESQ